jgi:hypothetical protein
MRKVILISVMLVAACTVAPMPEPVVTTMPPPPRETSWSATLQANPGFEGARGSARALSSSAGTGVTVNFGEVPGMSGTVRPWHIHYGRCGNDRGIVGNPNAYTPLRPGANGTASSSAVIAVQLMDGSEYFVNIHRSPTELQTIVACGQLTRGM